MSNKVSVSILRKENIMTGSIQEKNGKYYTVLNIKDKKWQIQKEMADHRPARKGQQTKGRADFASAYCRIRSQSAANAEKSVLRRLDAFHRGEQKEHRRTHNL